MPGLRVLPELKDRLAEVGVVVVKRKGRTLFRVGDEVTGVFLLQEGEVQLGNACDERVYGSRVVSAGAVIGLPATLSGLPYSLTAQVTRDAQLVFVPRAVMVRLLKDDPDLSLEVMRLLSEEINIMRAAKLAKPRETSAS